VERPRRRRLAARRLRLACSQSQGRHQFLRARVERLPRCRRHDEPRNIGCTYLDYLSELGASFDDVVETTVDGHPATVMTATTSTSLDGSIGCHEEGLFAADCFRVQPDLILRMAVIDTEAGPLLIWVRDIRGADDRELEYDSFDEMLASLRFPE
jgi:hypothetical protein